MGGGSGGQISSGVSHTGQVGGLTEWDVWHRLTHRPDWFNGLSTKFISAKAAKLLVLAGADKLDTPLMIAQMQGKFQLSVVQNVGHCLQEVRGCLRYYQR